MISAKGTIDIKGLTRSLFGTKALTHPEWKNKIPRYHHLIYRVVLYKLQSHSKFLTWTFKSVIRQKQHFRYAKTLRDKSLKKQQSDPNWGCNANCWWGHLRKLEKSIMSYHGPSVTNKTCMKLIGNFTDTRKSHMRTHLCKAVGDSKITPKCSNVSCFLQIYICSDVHI